jgi:ABC-type Fe3+/spermidine/putrescine transport system ATPase subunit
VTPAERELALHGLSASAGSFRLDPVDLDVRPGDVLVVLGPSGAGKTTLLDTIAGFRSPTTGRVHLAGKDITHLPPEHRRIGVVFQHAALFPHLTVRENVRFGPRARGHTRHDPAQELLTRFGLIHLADRRPRSLSGGERQRVALARALAADPELLLLDEPLSALDQPTREELRGALQDVLSGLRIPAIHVTHDRDEALTLGDHVAVIVDGQLRQLEAAHLIATQPADPDVARLLGWIELGHATTARGVITLGDLHLPTHDLTRDLPETAAIFYRPEGVLIKPAQATSHTRASLTRTIAEVLPTVPLARVAIAGEPPLTALVLHRDLTRLGLHAGKPVDVQLPTDSLKAFAPTPSRPDAIAGPRSL